MALSFRSTNRLSPAVSFREAILRGQAPDGGLYMPDPVPVLSRDLISSFRHMSYAKIAAAVMQPFVAGSVSDEELESVCAEAYTFDVPVRQVEDGLFLLYLDRGPTASFKDFAARAMARFLGIFARQEKTSLTVLVATSGDTGGAVADAFCGVPEVEVVVLFPLAEVTERQRKQMTTLGGNVTAVAIEGKFDDCQELVKRAFSDPALAGLRLTSANSINVGRLVPQAVYYFFGASRLEAESVSFSVPCGNFGNLMGGLLASRMGLPVKRFIAAVNENDEFPRFLRSGVYAPVVPSRVCSSNAMNVGHPSNLARLVALYGGWMTDERDERGSVVRKGVVKEAPDMERMRRDIASFSVSEEEVDDTIRRYFRQHGILLEPHGAVGVRAAEMAAVVPPVMCLETADPWKFPEKIRELLGTDPPVPPHLAGMETRRESFATIGVEYDAFRSFLLKR